MYRAVEPSLLKYDDEDRIAAGRVAHVTMRKGQRLLSYGRPLWGDREEDQHISGIGEVFAPELDQFYRGIPNLTGEPFEGRLEG